MTSNQPLNPHTLIPNSPIQNYLEQIYQTFLPIQDGALASYIPELTKANPNWFGIVLVTVDGHVYQVGDSQQAFTIQSVSKAITYGLALEDQGIEAVLAKVGVEPSGEAFNSISLDKETGRPLNPMINAGAIATTGLVAGANPEERFARILNRFETFVGHRLNVNNQVFLSERETGHRNRAIAHLLRNADIISGVPEDVVDVYFKQCSIEVTARDLAIIAASLANNGVNPITSVAAQKSQYIEKILSLMTTCGMYDYSGNWVYSVGMPAKSGVGGGIMAVLPGQFGLGVFSPLLDAKGNSVRGLRVCEAISRDFDLHLLKVVRATSASVVRVFYDAAAIHSQRRRHTSQRQCLAREGQAIRVYELQGELMFASTDSLLCDIWNNWRDTRFLIIDFKRVVEMDTASIRLFTQLANCTSLKNCTLLLTSTDNKYPFRKALEKQLDKHLHANLLRFSDTDHALEWCEDQLLESCGLAVSNQQQTLLSEQYLCHDFSPAEMAGLEALTHRREFAAGETIFRAGEEGNSLFFLVSGLADMLVDMPGGKTRRVVTMCAGMSFGDFSLISGEPRSTHALAMSECICLELMYDSLDAEIRHKLTCNLARELARRLNDETRAMRILG